MVVYTKLLLFLFPVIDPSSTSRHVQYHACTPQFSLPPKNQKIAERDKPPQTPLTPSLTSAYQHFVCVEEIHQRVRVKPCHAASVGFHAGVLFLVWIVVEQFWYLGVGYLGGVGYVVGMFGWDGGMWLACGVNSGCSVRSRAGDDCHAGRVCATRSLYTFMGEIPLPTERLWWGMGMGMKVDFLGVACVCFGGALLL